MNPNDPNTQPSNNYTLGSGQGRVVQPLPGQSSQAADSVNSAADLIRQKLESLYVDEPAAKAEMKEVESVKDRSPHQEFMYNLSHSGKSLADIQTEWHQYYSQLPNDQKHQVWQEFYVNHNTLTDTPPKPPHPDSQKQQSNRAPAKTPRQKSVGDLKTQLLGTVSARGKAQKKHHLQSLVFGLGMGAVVLLVFMFGFFNERFIAPFITPSKSVSATPIIIDPTNSAVGPEPKIIIPKINVEIPIVFDEPTINEDAIQNSLEKGVVWYPTTSAPGETGNGVIFGHSANNIFNSGKYKFAFVLLQRLETGDTFYVQKDGTRYVYKVFDKKVVSPTDVSVLYPSFEGKPSTFTLITCDPPGTSLNRLVVTAEQISPNPANNVASANANKQINVPEELPSNSLTMWQRIKNWFS